MIKIKQLLLAPLCICLLLPLSNAEAQRLDEVQYYGAIDFSQQLRTWDGFGVNYVQSARSVDYSAYAQDYGGFKYLTPKQRDDITDLIFGEDGLQPDLIKMFLDPLHYDAKTKSYDHKITTEYMRYFTKRGIELSAKRNQDISIITTLYGPPPQATLQNSFNGRDLDFSQKDFLADYLTDWLRFLKQENLPIKYISLFNEADKPHGWATEGTVSAENIFDYNTYWSPPQVAEFMPFLRKKMDNSQLKDVGITPGECSSWQNFNHRLYDFTIANNPQALSALSLVTCHSFGGSNLAIPDGVRFLRKYKPELHAWVTSSSWGRNDLYMPGQIILNINHVKVNAYIPWAIIQTPTQWYQAADPNAAPPIRVNENGTYEVTPIYTYYKHFTRAGHAGMAISPVVTSTESGIGLVAFETNDTKYPDAFVVLNSNDFTSKTIAIKIDGSKTNSYQARRTWMKYGLKVMEEYKDLGQFKLENGYIIYTCPPHSVTTFWAKER